MRKAFTLIEVLMAIILVGVGMTAVLGLILKAARDAQELSLWAMSTPVAEAAVDAAIARGLLSLSTLGPVDLPEGIPGFQTPFALRIEGTGIHASADDTVITSGGSVPLTLVSTPPDTDRTNAATIPTGQKAALVWFRIRFFENAEDRAAGVPPRATYHLLRLVRNSP
ncbi:MAG: hypothetical protein RLZZ127_1062 [Planctomycetota bacterium]|jgi:prepilin-type N-terminal cleavage/methylation domain-containing protein